MLAEQRLMWSSRGELTLKLTIRKFTGSYYIASAVLAGFDRDLRCHGGELLQSHCLSRARIDGCCRESCQGQR